jgi:signal transduction histidine kinase/DNA-binding response OmpR family regulator
MDAEPHTSLSSGPTRALQLALGLTALALVCLAWNAASSMKQIDQAQRMHLRIETLRGDIVHLDEVLTMSARMAALTEDVRWEHRYRTVEPQLAAAIAEVLALAPEAGAVDIVKSADAANVALINMERRALEYVRAQRAADARVLLFSDGYVRQKELYADGMQQLDAALERSVLKGIEANARRVRAVMIISAIALPTIFICWLIVLTALKRWRAALVANQQRLSQQALELTQLNSALDRKVIEHARAQQAAEQANRAKSEFLANMSHEIRTPMNGVIGMTDLLLETELNSVQRDCSETVRDSAAALLTVINDILDFSKVEAGKLALEAVDMDLRDTVQDVARLLAIPAHAKGLEITVNVDPQLPERVEGDPGRLRQVLLNLGGNAVKFTQRGEVAIDVHMTGSDAQAILIRCEVRDTGAGIAAEKLPALFQPFSQLDTSTTRRFGGTGLGLSIVRRLAELMGGDSGVDSEQGVGSTFWFTARLGVSLHAPAQPRAMHAVLQYQRVLVVDDNATNRKVLAGQLELCGLQPVCAASAQQALALMNQAADVGELFAVALLDHQMPDYDGAELGRAIIGDERLKATRLILLTSSGQRGEGQQFSELGFAGYLLKPVAQRDLIDCLLIVLAANAEEWHTRTQSIVTRHDLRALRAHEKRCVLVADDNVVNQKVACRMLENLGYRADAASNGSEALTAWSTGRYDLILMDCQMPVLDGYEATREIRRREEGQAHIPIVALTADAMKGVEVDCAAAGMDDYISKPIDRQKLAACLERFLGSGLSVYRENDTMDKQTADS